jgi:DNA-binding HxlR family transcriptional regulator
MKPRLVSDTAACSTISDLLSRVGDKWTILVVRALGQQPMRFNELRREIGDISQKMLAQTLRHLERDGFVLRTVTPASPPKVDYALTALGADFLTPVCALAGWAERHVAAITDARQEYDLRHGAESALEAAQ